LEFWTSHPSAPTHAQDVAQQAEDLGWTGLTTVDSQNLSGDPYVFLALAATSTNKLGLMTSVTNPVTRHAAVTATSAMTVQKLSGGRMILGIGRGDSALAYLGRAPARLKWFERYLVNLKTYLRGEEVQFADTGISAEVSSTIDTLGLADAPTASAINWARGLPGVPVEVAATGSRVISIAARHADRVMLALGAQPGRIAWGIETAKEAARKAGRDPGTLKFGAYVNLVCHPDMGVARELGRVGTSLFARFSVMHGEVNGPADDSQNEVFRNVYDRYDMNKHARSGGRQTTALTDDFMDSYAILGDADACIERLKVLSGLGVDKFCVAGPAFTTRDREGQVAAKRFTDEVMPVIRNS
jgi:5,10-methylenetetrahydromethanopterin reductase